MTDQIQSSIPKFLFLDTETTGLDPVHNEVIQVAAVMCRWDLDALRFVELESREYWFEPSYGYRLDAKALEVNGYPQRWVGREIANRELAMVDIRSMLGANVTLAGHNVGFDIGFVEAEFARWRLGPFAGRCSHRKLDTQSIGFLDVLTGVSPSSGLAALHKIYNIFDNIEEQHTAMADVRATIRLAERFARVWAPGEGGRGGAR